MNYLKLLENKTYVFDLDSTLCTHEKDYKKAKPFKKRIKIVNELHDAGHRIIIDTARGSVTGIDWFDVTKKQLKKWKVKFDELRVGEKPYYDFIIDDKAINADEFFLCD